MPDQKDRNIDFTKLDYLKIGNARHRQAYTVLTENKIMTCLQSYDPILVGTIPINIDIENSDLDIICYYQNQLDFAKQLKFSFSKFENFVIRKSNGPELKAVKTNFRIGDFEIEIFGQNIPTRQQNAYRHMLIEYKILAERDEVFRQKIIDLKRLGIKTEPAFAQVLGLSGDPYSKLLVFESE